MTSMIIKCISGICLVMTQVCFAAEPLSYLRDLDSADSALTKGNESEYTRFEDLAVTHVLADLQKGSTNLEAVIPYIEAVLGRGNSDPKAGGNLRLTLLTRAKIIDQLKGLKFEVSLFKPDELAASRRKLVIACLDFVSRFRNASRVEAVRDAEAAHDAAAAELNTLPAGVLKEMWRDGDRHMEPEDVANPALKEGLRKFKVTRENLRYVRNMQTLCGREWPRVAVAAGNWIAQLYLEPPANVTELDKLLKEAGLDETEFAQIAKGK